MTSLAYFFLILLSLLAPSRPLSTPPPAPPRPNPKISIQSSLDSLYTSSQSIRCPFFRRRAQDVVDSSAIVLRFLVARHKTLFPAWAMELTLTPPGSLPLLSSAGSEKLTDLSPSSVLSVVEGDWERQYYVTGHLTPSIYSDSCLFTGPDPDLPVRGLRKYLAASSHLFDPKTSSSVLTSSRVTEGGDVEVDWRLEGNLRLPWRPEIPTIEGTTLYVLGGDGLVEEHREVWKIGVADAFFETLAPERVKRWAAGLRGIVKTVNNDAS